MCSLVQLDADWSSLAQVGAYLRRLVRFCATWWFGVGLCKKCSLVHLGTNYCYLVQFGTVQCMLLHGRYVIGAFQFVYVTVKESLIVS